MTVTLEHSPEVVNQVTETMTATAASRQFASVLERAKAGQTIVVTKNGQPMAQITPPPEPKPNGAALIAFLESWEGDSEGFSPDFMEWLDSLAEPNERDEERMAWLDNLHSTPAS